MKFPRIAQEAIRNVDQFVKLLDEWRQRLDTLTSNSARTVDVLITNGVPFNISTQSKAVRVSLVNAVGVGNVLLLPTLGWLPGNGFVTIEVTWLESPRQAIATVEVEEQ